MTKEEFLKAFFEEANLQVAGGAFSFDTALSVFKAREMVRKESLLSSKTLGTLNSSSPACCNQLKQLKEDSDKQWENCRKLGYEYGLAEGQARAKDIISTIEEVRNYTIQDLIEMVEDRKYND